MPIDMADPRFAPPPFPPIEVFLNQAELGNCRGVGQQRHMMHEQEAHHDAKVRGEVDGLEIHQLGAMGEYVISKAFNLPWDGKFFKNCEWQKWRRAGHDVSGVEVRATDAYFGRLIIHEAARDNPCSPFVLVRSHRKPVFEIVGWYWGYYAQRSDWWVDVGHNRPAHFVPNSVLYNPIYLPHYIPNLQLRRAS